MNRRGALAGMVVVAATLMAFYQDRSSGPYEMVRGLGATAAIVVPTLLTCAPMTRTVAMHQHLVWNMRGQGH